MKSAPLPICFTLAPTISSIGVGGSIAMMDSALGVDLAFVGERSPLSLCLGERGETLVLCGPDWNAMATVVPD